MPYLILSILTLWLILTAQGQQQHQKVNTGLDVHSSTSVQFLIVDPLGRRTGYDGKWRKEYVEIPSSSYDIQSIGPSDTSDTTGIESREFTMAYGTPDTLISGYYQVKVFCDKPGKYWLDVLFYRKPSRKMFRLSGDLSTAQTRSYSFRYVSDPTLLIVVDSLQPATKW